jgi:hypothetical protein
MFPALALVLGYELTRLSARALMWIALPLAIGGALLLAAYAAAWDSAIASLATDATPVSIYRAFGPWVLAALASYTVGGVAAFALFRAGTGAAKTWGIAALALSSLVGMQLAFTGHDAFALVRSTAPILAEAQRANGQALDPAVPVYQVGSYDQTLPFYLRRPTPLVEYRDEMTLGILAEPHKAFSLPAWMELWSAAPQGYALMSLEMADDLSKKDVPFRVLARDPRRVFVARR